MTHLTGRLPHAEVNDLFMNAGNLSQAQLFNKIEHIAGVYGKVVCDFRDTVKLRIDLPVPRHGPVLPWNDLFASIPGMNQQDIQHSAQRLRRVYGNRNPRPKRVASSAEAKSIKTGLNHRPPFPRLRTQRNAPFEEAAVLLALGRIDELCVLIRCGVDLRNMLYGGYSHFFNGGLMHILADTIACILLLNQLLFIGVSPREAQSMYSENVRSHELPARDRILYWVGWIIDDIADVYDYRACREVPGHQVFSQRVKSGTVTLDDVRIFLKDVVFPQLYLGAAVMCFNQQFHGPTFDPKRYGSVDGWPVEQMVCELLQMVFKKEIGDYRWSAQNGEHLFKWTCYVVPLEDEDETPTKRRS